MSWQQIADEFTVSRQTPIEAMQRVRKKLGLKGRVPQAQLVAIAMREGWIL
jgi:DNA-binding CsgD family transcriptional regulator